MKQLIIDRIESGIAVCEYEEGKSVHLPTELLPENVKEGSVLKIRVDRSETKKRQKKARELQDKLFGR